MARFPGKKHELLGPHDGSPNTQEYENMLVTNRLEWGSFDDFAQFTQIAISRQKNPRNKKLIREALFSVTETLSSTNRFAEYKRAIEQVFSQSTHSDILIALITHYVSGTNRNFPVNILAENTATVLQYMSEAWAEAYRDNYNKYI